VHPSVATLQCRTLPSNQGGLRRRHVSYGSGSRPPDREGSGITTCPVAPNPASLIGRAPASPRV
jgi:hypothetical protein